MDLPKGKKIILFDGICNLCDSAVQFIIRHDQKDNFRFVAMESALGQQLLSHIGLDRKKVDSIILYEPAMAYYIKSDAILQIFKKLQAPYNMLTVFRIVPKSLRDALYDYVARNRFNWYGKKHECLIPSPETRNKFL